MSDCALAVFVKRPAPGAVKTRLAAAIGPAAAAELYRALAERVLEATTPAPGEYERLVFYDPPEAPEEMHAWLPGVRLLAQSTGDLGERMSDAAARAFARGATRVAIVGTDTPGLSRETVVAALDALDAVDVVIGPTADGGYYLLALREPRPELFAGVAWSTPAVARETRARAAAAGLLVRELPLLRDVDTLEDVRFEWPALRALLAGRPRLRASIEEALTASPAGIPSPGRGSGPAREGP
ncbi:MAG TPA: TIGR04282 family arsenosugar biosynthesis glycosyltransferase [Vicinamibacteria bacterium]|nr:TIGR04282 family arsenosugar biosynthesis glycosyltransferase [Vicinamibacteria bacterium]